MRHLPIHWSEGLFLRPQHFQAADRHWSELIRTSEKWDHPYNYGILSLSISPEAVANNQLEISACAVRLKDGTVLMRESGQEFDRVDLRPAFDDSATVQVFLGVPMLRMGDANVGSGPEAGRSRFLETSQAVQDETAGGNDQELSFKSLNAQVLLSTQDTAGYELVPVARIQRGASAEAKAQIDENYFPPMLSIDAWPQLKIGVIRAIYDLIGRKIELFAQQIESRGITLAVHQPGDLEKLLKLAVLNEAEAGLKCLSFAQGTHPFTAYLELCRIVGKLAIFGDARRIRDIPAYDHDDLARIFRWMRRQIELLLGEDDKVSLPRYFKGASKSRLEVALDPEWLETGWKWYVGVFSPNLSTGDIREFLKSRIDWAIGAADEVETLFSKKMRGLDLKILAQVPRELPVMEGWVYYEIIENSDDPLKRMAWKSMVNAANLGIRLNENLIVNRGELQGQRRVKIQSQGKGAELEFALFTVSPRPIQGGTA